MSKIFIVKQNITVMPAQAGIQHLMNDHGTCTKNWIHILSRNDIVTKDNHLKSMIMPHQLYISPQAFHGLLLLSSISTLNKPYDS